MPTQFEPRRHTTFSGFAVEAGEGAKSGFFGGVRAGVLGTLLGAGLLGLGLGAVAYAGFATWGWGAAISGYITSTFPAVAAYLPTLGVGFAPAAAVGTGILSGLVSFATPLPYLLGGALALIGGTLGLSSGASHGVDRVEGEQTAAMRDLDGAAQTAMVRDMAQMRTMQASARLSAAQGFIEQQVAVRTAAVTPPEATTVAAEADKPKNPLIQAEGTKIDAATVAKMGLASMPVQEMAKA